MNGVTQPERGRGTMLSVVMAAAALIALLAFAPFASAANDPLASGTTTLTLNKNLYNKLGKNGVKVQRYKPATVTNRTVTLSVNGGSLDPTTGKGTIRVSGGFKFTHGKTRVPLKVLAISTAKNFLDGKVGNNKHKIKIATVSGVSFTRNGFGTDVSVKTLKLTGNAAKQLTHKLGLDKSAKGASASSADSVFKSGQVMGGSSSTTQPSTVTVLTGRRCHPRSGPQRGLREVPRAWHEPGNHHYADRPGKRNPHDQRPVLHHPTHRWNARPGRQFRDGEQRRRYPDRQTSR